MLGPLLVIPVRGIDRTARPLAGSLLDPVQHLMQGQGAAQVDTAQPQTSSGGVDVGIDKGGRDQRSLELDHRIDAVGMAGCGLVGADPRDRVVGNNQRAREGVRGPVHKAAAVQGGSP